MRNGRFHSPIVGRAKEREMRRRERRCARRIRGGGILVCETGVTVYAFLSRNGSSILPAEFLGVRRV